MYRQDSPPGGSKSSSVEPSPASGAEAFEPFQEGDFHGLGPSCAADPQYNDRRLATRRKLLALGKEAQKRTAKEGCKLDPRSSLHNPTTFNGMRVSRLWTYLVRAKAEKTRLKRVIGAELAGDLDSAYKNAYLCLALEAEALEVSLRIHSDAWYDGQNLVNRLKVDGPEPLLAILNALPGYRLRMHDWKGEWPCGSLSRDGLEEFLSYYTPGEHRLLVEQRIPCPAGSRGPGVDPGTPEAMVGEIVRLLPLYRYAAWSKESDHLFSSS